MRPIAEFVMRGRMQAALVAGLAAAIPALFWLSAAVSSFVLLRKGFAQALPVIMWALMPAMVWAWYGDPFAVLMIASCLVLAAILRSSTSWLRVLLLSVVTGYACVFGLELGYADSIAELAGAVGQAMPEVLAGMYEQLAETEQQLLLSLLAPVLTGMMAATIQLFALLSLVLARYWQASLFNPGGFGKEFRSLRLPFTAALALLLAMLFAPSVGVAGAVFTPLCALPLGVAGMALVHGLAAKHKMGRVPLIAFYLGLIFFVQLLYPLLLVMTLADSVFDLRGLKASAGKAN